MRAECWGENERGKETKKSTELNAHDPYNSVKRNRLRVACTCNENERDQIDSQMKTQSRVSGGKIPMLLFDRDLSFFPSFFSSGDFAHSFKEKKEKICCFPLIL